MKDDEADGVHDEADLHAWVDGRLDADGRARVRARLEADPEAARMVEAWTVQKDALRSVHASVLGEPLPASLAHAASRLAERSGRAERWSMWGGIAASVLLAFALGWIGHGRWNAMHEPSASSASLAKSEDAFGRQAMVAHAVYTPEVRHPVEVEADQQEHLVQWLSKRLNRPLKLPRLADQGFELVGGRLLPGDKGARAQFMYQNAAGERITLYVGALDALAAKPGGETAFRFASEAGVATFYWVDQGFGYALAGKLARPRLLSLSESVYKQL